MSSGIERYSLHLQRWFDQ